MGNGIKMRSAMDAANQPCTVEYLQSEHDAQPVLPDLLCPDPSCRQPVRFVPRHQQTRKNRMEPVDVPAYIGLRSGSKHANGCRFDATKRIEVIADAADKDFVAALEDGKRELRLLLLHNGLTGKTLSGGGTAAPAISPGTGAGGARQYTASGNTIDSYLRTTADLLELRELCELDAQLASRLTLRFGSRRIAWNDFFFEPDRYDEAWEQLKAAGGKAHPIALVGEVQSIRPPKPGASYTSTFLNCRPRYKKTDQANVVHSFEVSAMHTEATWLASFSPGTNIIMFGMWECKDPVQNVSAKTNNKAQAVTYVAHKLTLRPKFKLQILKAF